MSSSVSKVRAMTASWARAAKAAGSSAAPAAASFSTSTSASSVHHHSRPSNVGIVAIESYVAGRCVSQEDLEKADGVSAGKYTIGLGQKKMAFVDDREDINSVCLTAVQRLLDRYSLDPRSIGRLEVGTESLVDKSKSTKTSLMRVFEEAGNRDIEGCTSINACYGGTAAFFNSAAWVESSEWDGRYALFVAGDIAVYSAGPARPTGGVGAVAVLIGPNAPLSLVPRSRASHAVDAWDFYKPALDSEYPAVDGRLSQTCYLRAVDDCYNSHLEKAARNGVLKQISHASAGGNAVPTVDSAFDYNLFHSPYNKLVQQSFKRMLYNDAKRLVHAGASLPDHLKPLLPFVNLSAKDSYSSKDLDKALASLGQEQYQRQVGPTVGFSQNIGNSYTGALWTNVASTVDALGGAGLDGKRLGCFSYGSGALATMFAIDAHKKAKSSNENPLFSLDGMKQALDLQPRLAARKTATPAEFTEALAMRERSYGKHSFKPAGSVDNVPAGGWYLKEVQANHSRVYERK